ncbi:Uma2 family endonuclease [Euhalothece natronophila Z-M001]|uniref:Uma2 family endonuclease n=1 Tax=Euhalothece natronophila Z-M001 TaxID=522448 RepID=A0A5B8NMH5_9CHRO|nr:Uma2 family endonuclease [Euhalothece natronophila]QDZ39485.1 Uma2 family endonuclease [Euhalothece natronophila Z-M001]
MISQPLEQKKYTAQEYLDWEVTAQQRHEFINGDIIPMAGGTPNHSKIILNFGSVTNFALKSKNYDVFVSDLRLHIPEKNIYTYPDIMIVEGELELQSGRKDTILNPCLIAEVLSNSTQGYDKDEKFQAYRTIPSFREYILIDQYSPHIEHYRKTNTNQWLFTEYQGLSSILALGIGEITIPLSDIYDKVNFESE